MTIRIALNHRSSYRFDRPVVVSPHLIRLRPAPHCRTPITAYSLRVAPDHHFINWQQDPQGNYVARLVFPERLSALEVEVDVIAEMTAINPFDFFLEPEAECVPFVYPEVLRSELEPYRCTEPLGPRLAEYLSRVDRSQRKTIDFLVDLNCRLQQDVGYVIRLEPGVQTCDETLTRGTGSCRDSAWLLVQILRNLGMAARFVSGYLIQLVADQKPLDGPEGPSADFTDLHAWCEVFLPGAGWVGLDPTSGLLAGEGHIPLACTPEPASAAPIAGATEICETQFDYTMAVARIHEDPRVTKPYTDQQWQMIQAVGHQVDRYLKVDDVRLTMGGEPTFVSIDDMEGDQWRTAAVGPMKRVLAERLLLRLRDRFAPGGLLHLGQGKWYPGEPLPRWALSCFWRHDGEPIWRNTALFADSAQDYGCSYDEAQTFTRELCRRLELDSQFVVPAYEDAWYYLWRERRLPDESLPRDVWREDDGADEAVRLRRRRALEQGLGSPEGCVLPLRHAPWQAKPRWQTGPWRLRADAIVLVPGDSPIGFRLPLDSLPGEGDEGDLGDYFPRDPLEQRPPLATHQQIRQGIWSQDVLGQLQRQQEAARQPIRQHAGGRDRDARDLQQIGSNSPGDVIRTALCVEPREGRLHVFMPPIDLLEDYLNLIAAVEETAEALEMPVVIEGYTPPLRSAHRTHQSDTRSGCDRSERSPGPRLGAVGGDHQRRFTKKLVRRVWAPRNSTWTASTRARAAATMWCWAARRRRTVPSCADPICCAA